MNYSDRKDGLLPHFLVCIGAEIPSGVRGRKKKSIVVHLNGALLEDVALVFYGGGGGE